MSTFRTFRAPDTRSALAMVKAALGADAIIVATREVENGLFRPKEIEVTAAVPETPAAPARTPSAESWQPRANVAPIAQPQRPAVAEPPRRTTTERYLRAVGPTPTQTQQISTTDLESAFASITQAVPTTPMPARFASPPNEVAPRGFDPTPDELQNLRSSMEEMRREMRRMTSQVRMEREMQLPPPAAELLSHLIARGVEDAIAEECVRQAMQNVPSLGQNALQSALRNALSERVVPGRAPWMSDTRRRVIALVGPTGVGKTTTIAKIAARAVMETKQKVSLITVDTYRIGASEQLARYGEIMGIHTQVARDRVELNRAIEKCGNADLILIDSAGRSVNEAVARQAEMLRSVEGIQLYLTLSACTGPREMAAAAERYRALNPERLIVTKVDEAIGPGSLLSASVRIGRPIVAVSDGQRVPEDLHALSGAELVELIMTADARTNVSGAR